VVAERCVHSWCGAVGTEREETASPDLGALSDFHQLLLLRLLRPDRLPSTLAHYVTRHLSLTTDDTDKLSVEQVLDVTHDSHTGILVLTPPVTADTDVSNVTNLSLHVSPVSIICAIAQVCVRFLQLSLWLQPLLVSHDNTINATVI